MAVHLKLDLVAHIKIVIAPFPAQGDHAVAVPGCAAGAEKAGGRGLAGGDFHPRIHDQGHAAREHGRPIVDGTGFPHQGHGSACPAAVASGQGKADVIVAAGLGFNAGLVRAVEVQAAVAGGDAAAGQGRDAKGGIIPGVPGGAGQIHAAAVGGAQDDFIAARSHFHGKGRLCQLFVQGIVHGLGHGSRIRGVHTGEIHFHIHGGGRTGIGFQGQGQGVVGIEILEIVEHHPGIVPDLKILHAQGGAGNTFHHQAVHGQIRVLVGLVDPVHGIGQGGFQLILQAALGGIHLEFHGLHPSVGVKVKAHPIPVLGLGDPVHGKFGPGGGGVGLDPVDVVEFLGNVGGGAP